MKYEVRRLTTDGKTWPLGETDDPIGRELADQWVGLPDTVQVAVYNAATGSEVSRYRDLDRWDALYPTAETDTLDEGGDAFPAGNATDVFPGMSFRWWAAGQAMVGLLAAGREMQITHEEAATWAVGSADALIAELRRTEAGR